MNPVETNGLRLNPVRRQGPRQRAAPAGLRCGMFEVNRR